MSFWRGKNQYFIAGAFTFNLLERHLYEFIDWCLYFINFNLMKYSTNSTISLIDRQLFIMALCFRHILTPPAHYFFPLFKEV
ncbi:hypothetical protein IFVP18_C2100002 [Vibrio parahaemolyticus]